MKAFTIAVPRYAVESAAGTHLDIYSKRVNAIKAALRMANEHRGTEFFVVKKSHHKRKVVFSIKLSMTMQFEDTPEVYKAFVEVFGKKSNEIKYWRKSDGSGN